MANIDKVDIDQLKNIPNDLRNLQTKIYKLDADKLAPAPVNLSKISDVGKTMLLKRMYRILRGNISRKIPGITNLGITAALNPKINEIKGEAPNITNLATTTSLIAVDNKMPNVSNLVKQLTIIQN